MLSIVPGERKPRVLWISDKPGWSYDAVYHGIRNSLRSEFDFETRYCQHGELQGLDFTPFDHVHMAPWSWPMRHGESKPPSWKTSATISSFQSWQRYGVAHTTRLLNTWYCATVLITRELHDLFSGVHRRLHLRNGVDIERFHPRFRASERHVAYEDPSASEPVPTSRHHKDDGSRKPFVVGWVGNPWMQGKRKQFFQVIEPAFRDWSGVELITAKGRYPYRNIIPHEEMPRFYARCDAYVHAAGEEHDTAPCPVLEAAASGVPIITCPVGDWCGELRDGENALLVESNVEAIRNAVERLRADPELQERLSIGARAFAEQNAWALRAIGYGELFRSTLGVVSPLEGHAPFGHRRPRTWPVARWPR